MFGQAWNMSVKSVTDLELRLLQSNDCHLEDYYMFHLSSEAGRIHPQAICNTFLPPVAQITGFAYKQAASISLSRAIQLAV